MGRRITGQWGRAKGKGRAAGLVEPGDTDAVVGRLQEWFAERPSMQGVMPYTLKEMLDRTLALYQDLKPGDNSGSISPPY